VIKGKLGLWREEARRHSEKNHERDFTVGIHQILQTTGKGGVLFNIRIIYPCEY